MPVVDDHGVMLGIITVDVLVRRIQGLCSADFLNTLFRLVLECVQHVWQMIRKRGGWLAALILGETLTATAMGHFEREIQKAAVLVLFVPLIISSGGNSGGHATTIIIRFLALRELTLRDWWRALGSELGTGLTLGGFLGAIGYVLCCGITLAGIITKGIRT